MHNHQISGGVTGLSTTGDFATHTHPTPWGPSGAPILIGEGHYHLTGGAPTAPSRHLAIALQQLLPPGPPFQAPESTQLNSVLDALAGVFQLWIYADDELLTEWDPRTTVNLLPDWEAAYGLPGSNPQPPSTLLGRQQALLAKERGFNSPTDAYMIQLAASLGYTATVTDPWVAFPPFTCDSACNSALYTEFWAFVWVLNATSQGTTQDNLLKWVIAQVTPAHTLAIFNLT